MHPLKPPRRAGAAAASLTQGAFSGGASRLLCTISNASGETLTSPRYGWSMAAMRKTTRPVSRERIPATAKWTLNRSREKSQVRTMPRTAPTATTYHNADGNPVVTSSSLWRRSSTKPLNSWSLAACRISCPLVVGSKVMSFRWKALTRSVPPSGMVPRRWSGQASSMTYRQLVMDHPGQGLGLGDPTGDLGFGRKLTDQLLLVVDFGELGCQVRRHALRQLGDGVDPGGLEQLGILAFDALDAEQIRMIYPAQD